MLLSKFRLRHLGLFITDIHIVFHYNRLFRYNSIWLFTKFGLLLILFAALVSKHKCLKMTHNFLIYIRYQLSLPHLTINCPSLICSSPVSIMPELILSMKLYIWFQISVDFVTFPFPYMALYRKWNLYHIQIWNKTR